MTINYNQLTEDSILELAEFIDWRYVPYHLLTRKIRSLASALDNTVFKLRLYLEDYFDNSILKKDLVAFPNRIFFFREGKVFLRVDYKNSKLWFSSEIWQFFLKELKSFERVQRLVKQLMETVFERIQPLYNNIILPINTTPWCTTTPNTESIVENYFYSC